VFSGEMPAHLALQLVSFSSSASHHVEGMANGLHITPGLGNFKVIAAPRSN